MNWQQLRGEKMYVLADQVLVSGAGFATNILLARALGLQDYGRYAALGMIQLFLLSLSMGSGTQVYQVLFPRLQPAQRTTYTNGLFYSQVGITLILLILIAALTMLHIRILAPYQSALMLWGMATGLYLLQDFLRKALITRQKAKQAFYIDLVTNLLQLLFLAGCWYKGTLSLPVAWLIVGATFIPSVVMGAIWLSPGRPAATALKYAFQQHQDKSSWLVATALIQWCSSYFFVLAAGWWIGPAALGALRLVQYLFGFLNMLLQAMENYVLPRAAETQQHRKYWIALLKKCLLLILPLLLLLIVFARPVLQIAGGNDLTQYTYIIYGLSLVYLLITAGYPVRIAIRSQQYNRAYFNGYILSLLFSITTAPWLLQHWQLYGVLTGLFITQLIGIVYWLYVLNHKMITPWK